MIVNSSSFVFFDCHGLVQFLFSKPSRLGNKILCYTSLKRHDSSLCRYNNLNYRDYAPIPSPLENTSIFDEYNFTLNNTHNPRTPIPLPPRYIRRCCQLQIVKQAECGEVFTKPSATESGTTKVVCMRTAPWGQADPAEYMVTSHCCWVGCEEQI